MASCDTRRERGDSRGDSLGDPGSINGREWGKRAREAKLWYNKLLNSSPAQST
jgi:hypothetical protein